MQLDSRFVKVAHDPGDPVLCSHCPFCGSGQITGRSDGGIDCAFCGQSFIVRVQPAFPGMPQAPGMGAPTDVGPDMMGMGMDPGMDPGMGGDPMMEGAPGEEDEEGGAPPFGDDGGEEGDDSAPPFGGGGDDEGASDSGGPPPPSSKKKDKGKGSKSKKESSLQRYRTIAGDLLTEDQYVRHLAILHSGMSPSVIMLVRQAARDPLEGPFPTSRQLTDYSDSPGYAIKPAKGGAEYNGHYSRGWQSSQRAARATGNGPSALERADDRREPDAWYDGYMDHATDRPKFHSRDCPAGDHDGTNGCTLS